MPYTLHWHNREQTILVMQGAAFSWQDAEDAFASATPIVQAVRHPVIMIIACDMLPPGSITLQIYRILKLKPPQVSAAIVAITSQQPRQHFQAAVIRIASQMFVPQFMLTVVDKLDDALGQAEALAAGAGSVS